MATPTIPGLQGGTLDQDIVALGNEISLDLLDSELPQPLGRSITADSKMITNIANGAIDELIRLLCMDEPFWFKSIVDGRFILQRETYQNTFHRSTYSRRLIESSKSSREVNMSGTELVNMFLSSDKWMDLFPTIINNASTIQVLENGLLGSPNGSLKVMKAKMHILSPLVPAREYLFIRYCKQVEVGVWVISDVSLPPSTFDNTVSTWKFPSGCIIKETNEGSSKVTWIEHVEVDRNIKIDRLFKDVICGKNAYGAERWVSTLERMCERSANISLESIPNCDRRSVIESIEEKRGVMKLAHSMLKMFCGTLDMSGNMEFPCVPRTNNGGLRVFICKRRTSTVQDDMIISAATSFRLPLTPQIVFDFLRNPENRIQWDVLCEGNPAQEIDHISNGTHCGNYTSIIWPIIPGEENMLILQESYTHALESLLVYAPIDTKALKVAIMEEDSSKLHLLPFGFTIIGDGQIGESEGSLVTMVYQVLASNLSTMDNQGMDSIDMVNTKVVSIVEKIKVALNCFNLD